MKALRPNAYVYQQALSVWNGLQPCFILSQKNKWQFWDMSKKAEL
jgi:hypothetical protein